MWFKLNHRDMQKKSSTNFVRKYIFGNIVAKAMALAMALALWLYAYNFSLARNKTYVVPVLVKTSEGWNVSSVDPETVEITLRCPRRFEVRVDQVLETAKMRCMALADMSGLDQQQVPVTLEQSQLGLPADLGIMVDAFEPKHVQVTLVREVERSLNVKLNLSDPPLGWEILSPYAIPTKVRVRGPEDIVSNVKVIESSEVDISFSPPSFVEEWLSPDYPVELLPYVTLNDEKHPISVVGKPQVRCRVRLRQISEEKTFPNVPVYLNVPLNYPYVVDIDDTQLTTSVTVRGPSRLVSKLTPENITDYVDLYIKLEGMKPDNKNLWQYAVIQWNIVGIQNARELAVSKLGISTCEVKITEREE